MTNQQQYELIVAQRDTLLEAARHAHIYLVQSCDAEKRELADELWAAIGKAEGKASHV